MPADEAESLWLYGEPEAWRRGRTALLVFAALGAVSQCVIAALFVTADQIDPLFGFVPVWLLFWLQFYLIWIGWHWVRWVAASTIAVLGFWQLVWSVHTYSGLQLTAGAFFLLFGAYVGFAPSVHLFAKRQRERISILHGLAVAAVFILLFASMFAGIVGIAAFRARIERQGLEFANTTFDRLFVTHEAGYLAAYSTRSTKRSSPEDFVALIKDQLGELEYVEAPEHRLSSVLSRRGVELHGIVTWRARFSSAPRVLIKLDLAGDLSGWKIEHLSWEYK
jgi:hypothetical protein